MEIIKGKYSEALVYADDMEQYARAQIRMICDNEISKGCDIRVMPDVHPGKVGTVGLTMTVNDRIIPHLLGVDIGCGVTCARLKPGNIEFQKLDKVIRERIPSGFDIHREPHSKAEMFVLNDLKCHRSINSTKAYRSLGTLGGGNHFIEVDKGNDGTFYLMIHSGSRHLGKEVTDHYVDVGAKVIKANGLKVPYEMAHLSGELMDDYLYDVSVVQNYAVLNRQIILEEIVKGMKLKVEGVFSCSHNYVGSLSDGRKILRKGAISALPGEEVIIPINMRDGVVLGRGKGNPKWNYSAPHGSGRLIRRDEVRNRHTVSEFKKQMEGIYCTCIGSGTLDEAPFVYRGVDFILEAIQDTVEVTGILKPVYNYKAGEKR